MQDFKEIFINHYRRDQAGIEDGLIELKKRDCSQVEAIKVLIEVLNVPLRKADEIVMNSIAWKDERNATMLIRNGFEDELNN